MADNEQEAPEERIDIDLSGIDKPFATVENGTYTISLTVCKLTKSRETQRPMLESHFEVTHPETNEQVDIRHYPLLDSQPGKFFLRQLIYARGFNDSSWDKNPASLVGAQVQAELIKETSEEFGEQNKIRRLLQEVPKRGGM